MTYACPGEDDDKTRGQQSRPLLEKRVRSYMSFTPSSDLFRRVRADLNNVQILKLGGFDLGDRGAWVLGKALASNESLGLLDLGFNGITSKGIEQIAEALEEGKNRTLKTLYLSGNGVGVGGAARLAAALRSNKSLKTLYLSGNGIGDEGLKHLADMLRVNTSLTALYLGTNSIGSGGMAHLADALTVNEHVEELMLSQNRIESAGVLSLVEAFATANLPLQTLEIGFNGIDAAGVTALADVLDSRPNQLQNLYLDNNPVGDAGAAALGRCLAKKAKSHSSLRVLDLSYAQLSLLGFRDLCMGLRDSTTLMGLLLDGHDWASTKYMERPPPNVASLAKDDAYQYAAKCIVTALQMNPSLPLVKLTGVNLSFAPGLNVDLPEGKEAMQPVCALNERIMNHVRRVAMGNQTNATAPPPSSELACGDRYQEMIHQSRKVLEKIAALPFDADELNALCAYYCADLLKPQQQQQQNKGDDPLHPAKRRRLSVDHSNEAINDQNDHPSPRISPPCRVAVYPKVEVRSFRLMDCLQSGSHRLRLLARREDEIERHCGVLTVLRQLHYLVKSLNSMENASALIETVLGTDEGGSTGSSASENNCFLNVIIQSFWHLVPLRRLLLDVTIKESADEKNDDGSETAATNVLKTLKATMMAYEDPSSGSLHPKELRQGLSLLYKTDMIELTEAERATLKRTRTITSKSVEGYVEKPLAVFDPNSIPHIVFSHQIYDRHVNSPPKEDIQTLLSTISDTLDLSEAFSVDGEAAKMAQVLHGIRAQYRFKGFVCYYGKHYFAFFFSTAHQLWLLFDDNKVTDIGKWTDVVEQYVRCGSSSAKSAIIEPSDARVAPAAVVTLQNANGSLSQLPTAGASKLWQNITAVNEAIAMPPRTNIMLKPLQPLEYDVEFPVDAVVLGLYLEKLDDDLCVTAFPRTPHGDKLEAEASGVIGLFDTVVMANGHPLGHYTVDRALKMIQAQKRPLRIRFKKSQRVQTLLDMGFSLDRALEGLRVGRGSVDVAAEHCSTSQT
ncbi:hypothetical protein DYB32_005650 [Aphanomyces invadans]|uniref:UBA domain-containing protein n=1 Tax=Aphanomyces invadans TaxID=157072 RepID=A0A418AU19_9STRA|nr:hypothetical protein DYB32_005650 [Aphanomyces invadans]